jgi:endoglucanase
MGRIARVSAAIVVVGLVLSAPLAAGAAEPAELIPGGTFDSGIAPWFATTDMTALNDNGSLCVDVPGGTTTAWSSIVGVDGVPIVSGRDYDFSFTATGETPVPVVIRALVQQPVSPWNATFEANPAIGGEATEFSYSFHSTLDLPEGQVVFQIGGASADWRFCLDNVHLAEGDPAPAFVPETGTRVRVNQLGYLTSGPKHATLMTDATEALPWTLRDASGSAVATGSTDPRGDDSSAGSTVQVIDFSDVTKNGEGYTIEADGQISYPFAIAPDLYAGLRYDALHYFSLVRSGIAITDPGY